MTSRTLFTAFAATAIAIASAGMASAKDNAKSAPHALPGVDGDYSILGPAPEPDDRPVIAENGDRIYKYGSTEVRIRGYVRVDVGAGTLRPGR